MTEALRLNAIEIDNGKWRDKARCKNLDPRVAQLFFFPTVGHPTAKLLPDRKRICEICPVNEECLEFAVLNGTVGIWNNTSGKQRRAMKPNVEKFAHRYSRPYVPIPEDNIQTRREM